MIAVAATITTWIALDSEQTAAPHTTHTPTVQWPRPGTATTHLAAGSRGPGTEPRHAVPTTSRRKPRPLAPAKPVAGRKAEKPGDAKKAGHAKKSHRPH
jgi:hypothetical protein